MLESLSSRRTHSPTAWLTAAGREEPLAPLREALGEGRVVSCVEVHPAGQAFVAALVQRLFPGDPLLVVAPDAKRQEALYQEQVGSHQA